MTQKNNLIYFFIFLLFIPLSYSITLQELINSYDYTYLSNQINITNILHYGNDTNGNSLYDYLIINISTNNSEGNYTFIGDLYKDNNLITTISDTRYLSNGERTIPLYYNAKLLNNSIYNLSLTIQENYLTIYRNNNLYSFDFDDNLYEKPDISMEINSYELISNDADAKYEIQRINITINSTINGTFEINALIGNNKTINSKKNYSLTEGINNIYIDFDGKSIRKERINNPKLYSITINNMLCQFDFNYSLNYILYDFDAEQSILSDSYSDAKIDLNDNNLSEFLQIDVGLGINESGSYSIELELNDLYDNYVKKITNEFNLSQGEQIVNFRINGADIYNSKVNGPYLLEYVGLKKNNLTLDYVSRPFTASYYTYDEFERPSMPDLVIKDLEIKNETTVKISVLNEGDSYAFAFNVNLFDENFNLIRDSLIDYLSPNNSRIITYNINLSTISRLYSIIDYNNNIEEINETNNLFAKDLKENPLEFNISLSLGWNLFSFPLNPKNRTIRNIFANYSKIFIHNGTWQEISNLSEINLNYGYWISSLANQTLTIEGQEFTYPISFNLTKGWNLISYPSLDTASINQSLGNITYDIVLAYEDNKWFGYSPNRLLATLQNLTPWQGYWVKVPQNTTWAFDGRFK